MPAPIEDYALLGDLRTAALVSRSGSVEARDLFEQLLDAQTTSVCWPKSTTRQRVA